MRHIIITLLAAGSALVAAANDDGSANAPRADWQQQMQSSYTWKPEAAPDPAAPDPESAPLSPLSYLKSPVSEDSSDLDMLRYTSSDSTDGAAHSLVPFLPAQRPTQPGIYWLGSLWMLSKFKPPHSLHGPHSLRSLDPSHALKHPYPTNFKNMLPLLKFQVPL